MLLIERHDSAKSGQPKTDPHTTWNYFHDTTTEQLSKGKNDQTAITSYLLLIQFYPAPLFISTPLRSKQNYTFIKTTIFIRSQVHFCQDLEGSEDLSSTICSVQSAVIFLKPFMQSSSFLFLPAKIHISFHAVFLLCLSAFQNNLLLFEACSLTIYRASCKSQRNFPLLSVSHYVHRIAALRLFRETLCSSG